MTMEFKEKDLDLQNIITDEVNKYLKRDLSTLPASRVASPELINKYEKMEVPEDGRDIYEILNEDAEGRLKFNSVMDVLGNQIFEEKPIEDTKEKPKKSDLDQSCQFKPKDKVQSEPSPGKAKFKIGDLVYIKSLDTNGRVVDIFNTRTNDGKTRKLYQVVYGVRVYADFLSYQLEKVQ